MDFAEYIHFQIAFVHKYDSQQQVGEMSIMGPLPQARAEHSLGWNAGQCRLEHSPCGEECGAQDRRTSEIEDWYLIREVQRLR